MKFVEIYKLTDEKVDEFIKFINKQEEDARIMYLEYIKFDFSFVKNNKYKYNQLYKIFIKQSKNWIKQKKNLIIIIKQELKSNKRRIKSNKRF